MSHFMQLEATFPVTANASYTARHSHARGPGRALDAQHKGLAARFVAQEYQTQRPDIDRRQFSDVSRKKEFFRQNPGGSPHRGIGTP
jgi:hypothetical protein